MNRSINFKKVTALVLASSLSFPAICGAWGAEGHRIVGAIGLDYLDKGALNELHKIMGSNDTDTLVEWCNWPDEYRATEEGSWSEPKHYINMVPGESLYVMERDCPTGMCVTEAIGEYAKELGNADISLEKRQQAFGWVCHLVGDLHQPLHAGFGKDRGGNDVNVVFNEEEINLHSFWDSRLIRDRSDSWMSLYDQLSERSGANPSANWQASEVVSWTNESHAFAETRSYPGTLEISDEFADNSWISVQDQLKKGGFRLAWVINTVLAGNASQPVAKQEKSGKHHCKSKKRS
ncbi:MAG: hypothetical protein ACI9H8_001855 [Lysobacterales bacterium]|jgi:hypothetical protein